MVRFIEIRQSKATQHSYELKERPRKIATKMMMQEARAVTAETENRTIMEGVENMIEG